MRGLRNKLVLILLTLLVAITPWQPFEDTLYDLRMELRQAHYKLDSPIVIIDIDEKSLDAVGSWPWSRSTLAALLNETLLHQKASVAGLNFIFPQTTEESDDENLAYLVKHFPIVPGIALDLNQNYQAGELPRGLSITSEDHFKAKGWLGLYPSLAESSMIIGHLNSPLDKDGKLRRLPNLIDYKDSSYMPMGLALLYAALEPPHRLESWLDLNDKVINQKSLYIPFDFSLSQIPVVSAIDLLNGNIAAEALANSIVLIGSSSTSLGSVVATPVDKQMPGVAIHAYILNAALSQKWLVVPDKAVEIKLLAMATWTFLLLMLWHFISLRRLLILYALATSAIVLFNVYDFVFIGHIWELAPWLIMLSMHLAWILLTSYRYHLKHSRKIESLFSSYVPERVIEQLVMGDVESIERGERKYVTVLFADLVNFTALAERMDAETLTKTTRTVFNELTEVVLKHSGTVDKYMGDSIMAFWGAPLEDPEQAYNAVNAAQEMLMKIEALPFDVSIGIGINSGEAIVGNIGSDFRHTYSVMGDTVNIAARLESLTRSLNHPILLGEETAKTCKTPTQWVEKKQLKGKALCVDIYTLA